MASRKDFLQRAVDCYERQTYPNRELIIVTDENLTVGEKRNIGCATAKGVYVALFDDDDYSSPRRLEVQEAALRATGKDVTAFRQLPFVQDGVWFMHPGTDAEGVDSSLFFNREFWKRHLFDHCMIGQDAKFSRQAITEEKFLLMEDHGVMFAENHSGNTCDRDSRGWTKLVDFNWGD
jgi:glycosyltransferase involved in cell wall biosynthesis